MYKITAFDPPSLYIKVIYRTDKVNTGGRIGKKFLPSGKNFTKSYKTPKARKKSHR